MSNENKKTLPSISLHHSFDVALAAEYGIEEAILIYHFQHWINVNYRLKRNFYKGRYWVCQTQKEIADHCPYLSEDQVFRFIKNLIKEGVLLKGNFSKSALDNTNWYALNDQSFLMGTQEDVPEAVNNLIKEVLCL